MESNCCPLCGLVRSLELQAKLRPYAIGDLFGTGRLNVVWAKHGTVVAGDVGSMMLHLCAAADVAFGYGKYVIKFHLEHEHLRCEAIPVENGKI